MPIAEFRFYEELNDFLSPGHRKRAFEWDCPEASTVKHVIEALGVPHVEVDLILAGGKPVDFTYRIRPGDRITVYPQFESFDIGPVTRLRARPLRHVRFLADGHLAGLAKVLRMLGFDTVIREGRTTSEFLFVARSERRILLTRSQRLLMHRQVTHGIYVRARSPRLQCREVLERLQLHGPSRPFTRCLRCNHLLEEVECRSRHVPADVLRRFARARHCPRCDRVYWAGSHYQRMKSWVDDLLRGPG